MSATFEAMQAKVVANLFTIYYSIVSVDKRPVGSSTAHLATSASLRHPSIMELQLIAIVVILMECHKLALQEIDHFKVNVRFWSAQE